MVFTGQVVANAMMYGEMVATNVQGGSGHATWRGERSMSEAETANTGLDFPE